MTRIARLGSPDSDRSNSLDSDRLTRISRTGSPHSSPSPGPAGRSSGRQERPAGLGPETPERAGAREVPPRRRAAGVAEAWVEGVSHGPGGGPGCIRAGSRRPVRACGTGSKFQECVEGEKLWKVRDGAQPPVNPAESLILLPKPTPSQLCCAIPQTSMGLRLLCAADGNSL